MKIKILIAVLLCFVTGRVHAQKLSDLPLRHSAMVTNLIPVVGGGASYELLTVGDIRGMQQHNFGTISGGGTIGFNINTNLGRAVLSGSTFTVNLPTLPDTTNGYWQELQWTNTSGGTQVGSFQVATVSTALVRDELVNAGVPTLVATVTNGIGGTGRMHFSSKGGAWTYFDSSGDALTLGGGGDFVEIALSDTTTALTAATAVEEWRAPFALTIIAVRTSLITASSSGLPTVDINKTGTGTILSTKLSIDANETTSTTAATPAVISVASAADDDEFTFDIDVAGTGAKGIKVKIYYTRP